MARFGLDRRRFTAVVGPNNANESAPAGGKLPIR